MRTYLLQSPGSNLSLRMKVLLLPIVVLLIGCGRKEKSEVSIPIPAPIKVETKIEQVGVMITLPKNEKQIPDREMVEKLQKVGIFAGWIHRSVLSAKISWKGGSELILAGESKQIVVPEGTKLTADITTSWQEVNEHYKAKYSSTHETSEFVALKGSNMWTIAVYL